MPFLKRLTVILGLFSMLFLVFVGQVQAHTLKYDGVVGSTVHITPEDDPIAGEESQFYFEIKDKSGRYKPAVCDCAVNILRDGQSIFSESLFKNTAEASLENTSFTYTFPGKGVYTVQLVGKPQQPEAFQPFTLSYDIRVERVSATLANTAAGAVSSTQAAPERNFTPLVVVGGAVLLFVVLLFTNAVRGKKGDARSTTLKSWFLLLVMSLFTANILNGHLMAAFHAGHGQDISTSACCLPQPADLSVLFEVNPTMTAVRTARLVPFQSLQPALLELLYNRSPPAFS